MRGRVDKARLNRARSLIALQRSKSDTATVLAEPASPILVFDSSVLRYIAYLLLVASGEIPSIREIEFFLQAVLAAVMERTHRAILRQRSLPERGG